MYLLNSKTGMEVQATQNGLKQLQKTIASPFNFARNPNHKTIVKHMIRVHTCSFLHSDQP